MSPSQQTYYKVKDFSSNQAGILLKELERSTAEQQPSFKGYYAENCSKFEVTQSNITNSWPCCMQQILHISMQSQKVAK